MVISHSRWYVQPHQVNSLWGDNWNTISNMHWWSMAGVIQNWSTRNLDNKQTDYGNPHKKYAAIRYGNVKMHLHDKRSILKRLFLLPFYMYAFVYTRTHAHIDGHYALSVSNRQVCSFLLCLLHVTSMAFSWTFSHLGTAWLPNHRCRSIFSALLKESQQSPSPQERSKKPADPDVCLLLGPSYLHHPFPP